MKPSASASNRARPLLGTFFTVPAEPDADHAFAEAERLEKIFSRFQESSCVSAFNRCAPGEVMPAGPEFRELVALALAIWRESKGAFNPFFPMRLPVECDPVQVHADGGVLKLAACRLDLNGIAKGYIADRVALEFKSLRRPARIDAGGDICFLNPPAGNQVQLRVGAPERPVMRTLMTQARAVATSQAAATALPGRSSQTRYAAQFRAPLTVQHTATVLASSCAVADALTKVALFGEPADIHRCCERFQAQVLLFDAEGELVESYGPHENIAAV